MTTVDITTGTRVRAVSRTTRLVSLAGMQMKMEVQVREMTGVIQHLRGDHPTKPTAVHAWILPDEGGAEVEMDVRDIVEVLK